MFLSSSRSLNLVASTNNNNIFSTFIQNLGIFKKKYLYREKFVPHLNKLNHEKSFHSC